MCGMCLDAIVPEKCWMHPPLKPLKRATEMFSDLSIILDGFKWYQIQIGQKSQSHFLASLN